MILPLKVLALQNYVLKFLTTTICFENYQQENVNLIVCGKFV